MRIWHEAMHCKIFRRFYSKIPGIWLPVHLPLFLQASGHQYNIFRNEDMVGLC